MQMRYIRCFVVPGTMIFADFFSTQKKPEKRKEETDQEKNEFFSTKKSKNLHFLGTKKSYISTF